MKPVQEVLNKIKWDPNENPEDYTLYYFDRVTKELCPVEYNDAIIEEGLLKVRIEDSIVSIPLHRIRKITKKGRAFWERP